MNVSNRLLLCGVLLLLAPAAVAQDPVSCLIAPAAAQPPGPMGAPGTVAEAADYAQREAVAGELAAFEGGHGVFTGLLLAALVVVLVVLVV